MPPVRSLVRPAHEQTIQSPIQVLVVDDEQAVRDGLCLWLGERGFEVRGVSNLQAAVSAALEAKPDVILLDVKLGNEDGLELIPLLRDRTLRIPCVVLTAHAGPYDGFKAHALGVDDLLEKPSSPDEIAIALRRATSRSGDVDFAGRANLAELVPHSLFAGATDPKLDAIGNRGNTQARFSERVTAVLKFIGLMFDHKDLRLGSIAEAVGVSSGYLGRTFKKETGCSIIDCLHRRRTQEAAQLLRASELSVKQIADRCGYHNTSELDRHFRRAYGESPKLFRVKSGEMTISGNTKSQTDKQ